MPRTFDGTNDSLHTATGTLQNFTFGTFAAIIKRNGTTFQNIMTLHNSSGTSAAGLEIEDNGSGNNVQIQYTTSTFRLSTYTVVNADNWVLIASSKATGTVTPRMHLYKYSTDAWTHENASGTAPDCTAPGASGTMRFGEWETADDYAGDILWAGCWMRSLADAEIELLPHSLNGWHSTAPDALWVFDQGNTADKVIDQTGNGANESALTGTTVSTNSPPATTYGHEVIVLSSSAASGAPSTNAPAENATGAGTANTASVAATVAPGNASGSGASNAPTAKVSPNAGAPAGTGAANQSSTAVTVNAGLASGTGTANQPTAVPAISALAGNASGSGVANGPTPAVAPAAGNATGAGLANTASNAITVNAGNATGTGTANQPTVNTSGSTNAPAESATGTGVANAPAVAVKVNAGLASGTGTANAPAAAGGASASPASGTGTAGAATDAVTVNAGLASGAGSANQPTVSTSGAGSVNAAAGLASGTGSALDATVVAVASPTTHAHGWWSLISILRDSRQRQQLEDEWDRHLHDPTYPPVRGDTRPAIAPMRACPNDGEPLALGPDGELFCPFDGYRPELV